MTKIEIQRELDKIADKEGRLTADMVVEAAEPAHSPLHEFFEWDDSVAGAKFRIMQARQLIRSVHVEIKTTHRPINVVSYVRDPDAPPKEQGYRRITMVALDDNESYRAFLIEINRVKPTLNRMRDIAIVLGMEAEMDKLLLDFEIVKQRAEEKKAEPAAPTARRRPTAAPR